MSKTIRRRNEGAKPIMQLNLQCYNNYMHTKTGQDGKSSGMTRAEPMLITITMHAQCSIQSVCG